MKTGDTIAACATPPGRSWRGMVRVSGPQAVEAVESLGWRGGASGVLRVGSAELPVLVSVFRAGRSYTGEDSVEVQYPGNPELAARLLNALTNMDGVRLAEPGEFTARAYLGGRMTLAQAEGVAATIAARTDEQLAASRELLEGKTGARYAAWAEELATLLALVEAGIDFSDQEDVVAISPGALRGRLLALRASVGAYLGSQGGLEAGGALAKVALVGRPNAGKSTLFNALLGRQRAVTSPHAGTTRDVLVEELDLSRSVPGAGSVLIEDLAGLDAAMGGASEAAAQKCAAEAVHGADLLVWCDPSGRFDASPIGLPTKPTIRVRTFGDQAHLQQTGEDLAVCALDGWNLSVLRRAIADAATTSAGAGVAVLLPRHRRALGAAFVRMEEAVGLVPQGAGLEQPELIANALRAALDELGELVGQISPDEVIGRVFAVFCVGK